MVLDLRRQKDIDKLLVEQMEQIRRKLKEHFISEFTTKQQTMKKRTLPLFRRY